MTLTVRHDKAVTIADWTQAELNAQIALGFYPKGTTLADIALNSDWNAAHALTGVADVAQGGTGSSTAGGALANLGGQPLDADLTALAALTGTGVAVRTGTDTWALNYGIGGQMTYWQNEDEIGSAAGVTYDGSTLRVEQNDTSLPALALRANVDFDAPYTLQFEDSSGQIKGGIGYDFSFIDLYSAPNNSQYRITAGDGSMSFGGPGEPFEFFFGEASDNSSTTTLYLYDALNERYYSVSVADGDLSYPDGGFACSGSISAAGTTLTGLTANRAVATNGGKTLVSSATTSTELGYLSGVTSAVQTQLNNKLSLNTPWQPPTLTNAAASNNSVFYSSTNGKLAYKDAGGTVNNLY